MKKLIYSVAALAVLGSGMAWADGGDAGSQAGSAWRSNEDPITVPQGNSGWSPPWGYDPGNSMGYGSPYYGPLAQAYPNQVWRDANGRTYRVTPRRGDRDGDGVSDRRDRHPDDPRYR